MFFMFGKILGMHTYYLWASDLASVVVGPFPTYREALSHLQWCEARGDGAAMDVITDVARVQLYGDLDVISPEQDRLYMVGEVS